MKRWLHYLLPVLLVVTVISAMVVVSMQHRQRQLFVQLARLEQARNELDIEYGRLQLEQATLARITRVNEMAHERLGMRPVRSADIKVVRP